MSLDQFLGAVIENLGSDIDASLVENSLEILGKSLYLHVVSELRRNDTCADIQAGAQVAAGLVLKMDVDQLVNLRQEADARQGEIVTTLNLKDFRG